MNENKDKLTNSDNSNQNLKENENKDTEQNHSQLEEQNEPANKNSKENQESKPQKQERDDDYLDLEEFESKIEKIKNQLKSSFEDKNSRPDGKKGFKTDGDKFKWKKSGKTIFIWFVIILIAFLFMQAFDKPGNTVEFKSINEFNKYLKDIAKIEILNTENNSEISGKFLHPVTISSQTGIAKEYQNFRLIYPLVTILETENWIENGIDVQFKEDNSTFSNILISLIPWILILGIWIYILKRMQGGGNSGGGKGIFSFGKSRAKLVNSDKKKVTFEDVAGATEAKEELKEVIDFLKVPQKFLDIGAKIPRGVLLTGPPGTGKTLLAKAVAGEAGVPFFSMSGADFVEMFVGVGASRVRDLFEQGKKHAPCIIFIDELDAVGRHRGTGIGGGNDEREQTLNQLLVEMDGFDTEDSVIMIAATNRPDVLDPALLRPGRFDRSVIVDRPDLKAREDILKVHAKKVKINDDINFEVIAKGTPGLSGADLANIINEAALFAARRDKKEITNDEIEEAKDKVMMGVERKSTVISEKEKEITAYHESGHVLVAKFTKDSDPVHKVTIIPRGMAMGVTHYLPIEEKHSYSRTYIMGKLLHLFGGRVAEELIFNEITTGASNDIERATDLARKMVCEWGMSDEVGPIHYGVKNDNPFLGRELTRTSSISEELGKKIDDAIQTIMFNAIEKTRKILNENIDLLHALSKELIEKETLSASEIDQIIEETKKLRTQSNETEVQISDEE